MKLEYLETLDAFAKEITESDVDDDETVERLILTYNTISSKYGWDSEFIMHIDDGMTIEDVLERM